MKKQAVAQVTTPPARQHTDSEVAPPSSSLPPPSSPPAPPSLSPTPVCSVSVPAGVNDDHGATEVKHNQNRVGKDHTQNRVGEDHTQNHTQNCASENPAKNHVGEDHTQNRVGKDHTQNCAGKEREGLNDVNTVLQTMTVTTKEEAAAPKGRESVYNN